jgi:DNA relaxase NicK
MQTITSSNERAGCTVYVGKREKSDKFFRAYEKGFELAGVSLNGRHRVDGHPVEDIYRCEVELKAESRPYPWEVVERRDQYFAGAILRAADVLPGAEADILMRRPGACASDRPGCHVEHCRTQYGNALSSRP